MTAMASNLESTNYGVAFMQLDEVVGTASRLRGLYRDWHFFSAAIPTYIGGSMVFGWATDNTSLRQTGLSELRRRYQEAGIETRFYNPEVHCGAFALPNYLLEAIGKTSNEYR